MIAWLDPRLWLALLLSAALAGVGGYWKGRHDAAAVAQADQLTQAKDALRLITNAERDNDNLRRQYDTRNREIVHAYENKLRAVRAVPAGQLRLPASVCGDAAAQAAAQAAGGAGQPSAGTVALPEPLAGDLWRLAQECDATAEQLRAVQDWIEQNGLR